VQTHARRYDGFRNDSRNPPRVISHLVSLRHRQGQGLRGLDGRWPTQIPVGVWALKP
jgi:hypothetical protein